VTEPTTTIGTQNVTLENCDAEPIHIPGHIQPHGALLAFDPAGLLVGWSANAPELLRVKPQLGSHLDALALDDIARTAIQNYLAQSEEPTSATSSEEIEIGQVQFDLIIHRHAGRIIAEFERREQSSDEVAAFALRAHRSIDRVRRQKTVIALLEAAVADIRALTGFDRVMAYRFRHDESGDVVAEACPPALEPYLGRRYPASDIPAQARRLYTINTLRLIGDVSYRPVAVFGRPNDAPLDMSYCGLRSVSPIHIEYLQNLGVGASMSISLVINGRLWGLIACHHMALKLVPHSIRMACDVLAQVMSSIIQSLESYAQAALAQQAAAVRTTLVTEFLQAEDVMSALATHREAVCQSLGAQALIISRASRMATFGAISDSLSKAIIESLPATTSDLIERTSLEDWTQLPRPLLGSWVGLLALHFDPAANGWLIALRPEQIETVRWGGRPEKTITAGPLGPRLTPRGSFAEWQETVRGRAEPWDEGHRTLARQLLGELHKASSARHAEIERARTHLIAMLGHDLRDPLASISMAATVLERGTQQQKLGQRIQASSGRMQRLITQVLDMSRVQGGAGLTIAPKPTDLAWLVTEIVDEMRTAHPDITFEIDIPERVPADVDADRIAQIIGNLLSNARHHSEIGSPIHLTLSSNDSRAVVHVRNRAARIPAEIAADLFSPFKRNSSESSRNRTGLGLGLYIAQQIAFGHGGSIEYRYDEPYVVFIVDLPLRVREN
jgi:chemotaxis family two-component system sensor kinase Cph1